LVIYVDTSALFKLVRREAQSDALRAFFAEQSSERLVSSVLIVIETRRAALRESPEMLPRADVALTSVDQIGLSHAIVEAASRLPSRSLRSLDAVHLATALLLGEEMTAFVSYDKRLSAAAREHRLPLTAPGQRSVVTPVRH
jgi:predicted nucleic acid-binding protein